MGPDTFEWVNTPREANSSSRRDYFLTYKQLPDSPAPPVEIAEIYGREEALETIKLSFDDNREKYGQLQDLFGPGR